MQMMTTGEAAPGEQRLRVRASAPSNARLWGIHVLLVEDDAADTSLIMSALRSHPNVISAKAADSPDVVLQRLADTATPPNLILLDIHMPRMNGFEFLDLLRRIPTMKKVPVVFLTTSALSKDVVGARWSTALTYVVKPDTFAELQLRLDKVIKRVLSGR